MWLQPPVAPYGNEFVGAYLHKTPVLFHGGMGLSLGFVFSALSIFNGAFFTVDINDHKFVFYSSMP